MAAKNKGKGRPADRTTPVTEQFLLEGAWHALDQAGRLLCSASILFDGGDSSTALAIAMFGREELGRSKLLRDCAREVRGGSDISAQEVTRCTDDHVKKQAAASLSVVMRMRPGSAAWTAATDGSRTDIPDEERSAAHETVRRAFEAKAKKQPHARHEDRCSALYVDLNALGTKWRRPSAIGREDARNSIVDAVNDYALERERV